jgi:hypothetical protein
MLVSVSATVSFETEQASFLTHSEHFQQLTPGHDWRRFSSDPRILGEQEQQQRKSRGIDPGRPMICTPKKFDILSRLQLLDRGDDELVIEPPLLTTVGVWVPSLAAAKSISEALRASAASGQLQSSFETRLSLKLRRLQMMRVCARRRCQSRNCCTASFRRGAAFEDCSMRPSSKIRSSTCPGSALCT